MQATSNSMKAFRTAGLLQLREISAVFFNELNFRLYIATRKNQSY